MANLAGVLKDLQQERDRVEGEIRRIDKAIKVLGTLVGSNSAGRARTRRTMSAAARRRIAAAQRARWAKWKVLQGKKAA